MRGAMASSFLHDLSRLTASVFEVAALSPRGFDAAEPLYFKM